MAATERDVWPGRLAFLAASAALATSMWGGISASQQPAEAAAAPATAPVAPAIVTPAPALDVATFTTSDPGDAGIDEPHERDSHDDDSHDDDDDDDRDGDDD